VFTAEPAVSHRPVEAGRCLECHNFHQKEQFALLKASQPELCSECHEVGVPAAELPPPYPPQPSPAPDAGGDRGGAS
jgi:predicted CXXCH cytochrome family protein